MTSIRKPDDFLTRALSLSSGQAHIPHPERGKLGFWWGCHR